MLSHPQKTCRARRLAGEALRGRERSARWIPAPMCSAWHGPSITYFARVGCDLARLHGCLIHSPGIVCAGRGIVDGDVMAARLQGQDVRKRAFFDVVARELGIEPTTVEAPIGAALVSRFC